MTLYSQKCVACRRDSPRVTDQEIADGLVIAVRTVTTHVGNILNKTCAANRAEAASFANQHGLVTPDADGEG